MKKFSKPGMTKYGRRHKPGEMNRTESAYADLLALKVLNGEVDSWQFEAITFKLAADCRYTPDFAIYHADGTLEFVDVKGGGPMDPKSRVKIKCAADKFPQFSFSIAQCIAKKHGGGWNRETF